MSYSVFLSHSMSEHDVHVVQQIHDDLIARGIGCYVAERDDQYGKSLPQKVEDAIRSADCLLVLWTNGGAASAFVNQEVGFARALAKLRVWLVEKGFPPKGFDIDKEYLEFSRDESAQAISKLGDYLVKLKTKKDIDDEVTRRQQNFIGLVALVGLGYLLLSSDDE